LPVAEPGVSHLEGKAITETVSTNPDRSHWQAEKHNPHAPFGCRPQQPQTRSSIFIPLICLNKRKAMAETPASRVLFMAGRPAFQPNQQDDTLRRNRHSRLWNQHVMIR
jgi:hypothetical protein